METQLIKVSIIIPVYNVEKYIGECIDSIVSQKDVCLECIVVDDCGSDKSIEIAKERATRAGKNIMFRWIRLAENKGVSIARNTGIRVARGEYVCFVDPDDFIRENVIADVFRKIGQETPDIIRCNFHYFKDGESFLYSFITHKKRNFDDFTSEVENTRYILLQSMFFRRNFLLTNNLFFDEDIYFEDMNFLLKTSACENVCFTSVPDFFYYYRTSRKGSAMTSGPLEKHTKSILFTIAQAQKLSDKGNRFSNFAFEWGVNYFYGLLINPKCPNRGENIEILLQNKTIWAPKLSFSRSRAIRKIYRLLQKPNWFIRIKIWHSVFRRRIKKLLKSK